MWLEHCLPCCGSRVGVVWDGESSSSKSDQQIIMNTSKNRTNVGKEVSMCLCWHVLVWLLPVCGVVAGLLLFAGLSSLCCWLCQCWRRCVGCCMVRKNEMSRLWRFQKNDKIPGRGFFTITINIKFKNHILKKNFTEK